MANRINSYEEAKKLVDSMITDDSTRSNARSKVEGQIAGNLPFSPGELKSLGQGYRTNLNFRELEANVKQRTSSFIRLLFDPVRLVNIAISDMTIPINYRVNYAAIIAEEFHRMLKKTPRFFSNMSKAMRNMVVHGPGILYWPTEADFIPKSAKPGKVMFSKNSGDDSEEFDVITILDELPIDKIFSILSSTDTISAAVTRGWNTLNLLIILNELKLLGADEQLSSLPQTPEDIVSLVQRRSFNTSDMSKPRTIDVAYVYSKEEDGKITKSIIVKTESIETKLTGDKYLYHKESEFECFDELLIVMLNELENDGIHSIRGYGHRIYPQCVVSNRMLNVAIDGSILSSSIVLQTSSSGQESVADAIRVGPLTVIDEGYKVVTGSFGANLSPLIQMRGILQQNSANNFGVQRPAQEGAIMGSGYKTARETDYEMLRNNSLSNLETMVFYIFADRIYSTIVKKMSSEKLSDKNGKTVQAFKDRCIKRGVPESIMKNLDFDIEACRAIGNGSPEMQMVMTREMVGMIPYLPIEGQRNVIRDFTVARVGAENLERYYPSLDADKIKHFSHQLANIEDGQMFLGTDAKVSSDDDHPYHLKQHIESVMQRVDAYSKGELETSGSVMLRYIELVLNHVLQHMAYIGGALNKNFANEMMGYVKQLKVFHKQLQNQVRKEMAEAQKKAKAEQDILMQAAEMVKGEGMQVELIKIAKEHELKIQKEHNQQALREFKTMAGIQLKQTEVAANIENLNRLTDAEVRKKSGGSL